LGTREYRRDYPDRLKARHLRRQGWPLRVTAKRPGLSISMTNLYTKAPDEEVARLKPLWEKERGPPDEAAVLASITPAASSRRS
jgi:hypothetical protein